MRAMWNSDDFVLILVAKRRSYTAGFNLKAVEIAESSGNRSAEKDLGISEKLVHDWIKKKTKLKKHARMTRLLRPGRKAHWPQLENILKEWVLDRCLNGVAVSGTMIRLKAKSMAKEMYA